MAAISFTVDAKLVDHVRKWRPGSMQFDRPVWDNLSGRTSNLAGVDTQMDTQKEMRTAAELLRSEDINDRQRGRAVVLSLFAQRDPLAVYAVGTWHLHGVNGIERDPEQGTALIAEAARGFVRSAVADYAHSLESGLSVAQDPSEAFTQYLIAALMGDEDAVHDVARCLDEGIGTQINRDLAKRLFELYEAVPRLPYWPRPGEGAG